MKKFLFLSAALLSAFGSTRAYADPEPEGYGVDPASINIYVVAYPPSEQMSDGGSYGMAVGVGSSGQVVANAAAKFNPMRFGFITSGSSGSAYVEQHLSQTYVHTGNPGTYTVSFIHAIASGQGHAAQGGRASAWASVSGQANGGSAGDMGGFSINRTNGEGDDTDGFNSFDVGGVYEVVGPYSPIIYTQVDSNLYANADSRGSGLNDAMGQVITEVYPYAHYGTPPEGIGGEP